MRKKTVKLYCDICGKEVDRFAYLDDTITNYVLLTLSVDFPHHGSDGPLEMCQECNNKIYKFIDSLKPKDKK